MEIGRLASQIVRNKRRLLIVVLLYVLALVLMYPLLWRIGGVLRDHKPGLWGMQSWYALLIVGYVVFMLALCVAAVSFALRKTFSWRQWVGLLIGLTLTRGLLYSSITPPWQAPDEHAHFEYAALMGELRRVPTLEDISQELQKRIVKSMFDYDHWRLIQREQVAAPPDGFLVGGGITRVPPTHTVDNRYLYYPQIGEDPPLYYVVPALVHIAASRANIALELYLMRLTTVFILVALVGTAIWATTRLFPDQLVLAMGVTAFICLHPALAYMGGVVSNEILAALFATALLGVLVSVVRWGLSLSRGVAIVVLVILGLLTRGGAFLWAILLVSGVGAVHLCRMNRWVRSASIAIVVVGLIVAVIALRLPSSRARLWTPSQTSSATVAHTDAADGEYALRVEGRKSSQGILGQRLSTQQTLELRGSEVILSAAVRAETGEHPGELVIIDIDDHSRVGQAAFVATPTWRTVSYTFTVPENALHLQVQLVSASQGAIYFDQVLAFDRSNSMSQIPWLANSSGEEVQSVGEALLVRIGQRLGRGGMIQQMFSSSRENLAALIRDPWPLRLSFETFWGRFGAALSAPLPGLAFRTIAWLCVLSALGWGVRAYRSAHNGERPTPMWRKWSMAILAGAFVLMLMLAFMPVLALYGRWMPQGRYLFATIWPIATMLVVGWASLFPGGNRAWLAPVLVLGLGALDVVALIEIMQYFRL